MNEESLVQSGQIAFNLCYGTESRVLVLPGAWVSKAMRGRAKTC